MDDQIAHILTAFLFGLGLGGLGGAALAIRASMNVNAAFDRICRAEKSLTSKD